MQQFGSIQNQISGTSPERTFEVGDGMTKVMWTDRKPYTIIAISKSGKTMVVQEDKAIRTDDLGMSDAQQYEFERDPEGPTLQIRKAKDGQWYTSGGMKSGTKFAAGRSCYHDYSF